MAGFLSTGGLFSFRGGDGRTYNVDGWGVAGLDDYGLEGLEGGAQGV